MTTADERMKRYLEIRQEIKDLERELVDHKIEIMRHIQEDIGGMFTHAHGHRFSIRSKKSYKYTDRVKMLQETVRAQKKMEEATGTADLSSITSYLVAEKDEEGA